MKEAINIVYSTDDNYGKYLGISMLSLFESNKNNLWFHIYVLDCGIQESTKRRLESIANKYKQKIDFIAMDTSIQALNVTMGVRKISIASYARLFLSSVLPLDCDKVIYLDCDTIVTSSVLPMWKTRLGKNLVAGVLDTVDSFFLKKIGIEKNCLYVNAGILVVNVKYWREEQLESRFLQQIDVFQGMVPHHDQGVINSICKGRILQLPLAYNVTSNIYTFSGKTIKSMYDMKYFYDEEEMKNAISHPVILHFTTGLVGRPWEENCSHPREESYKKIVKISPWKKEPLEKDSRKISVKVYGLLHQYAPSYITGFIYRCLSKVAHMREYKGTRARFQ